MNSDHEPMTSNTPAKGLTVQLTGLAIFVFATGALLFGILSLVQPQYESVAALYLEQKAVPTDRLVSSQITALSSHEMVAGFFAKTRLDADPEFNGTSLTQSPVQRILATLKGEPDPTGMTKQQLAQWGFAQKFTLNKGLDAQTVTITVRSTEPQKSARLANQYGRFYIDQIQTTRNSRRVEQAPSRNERGLIKSLKTEIAAKETKLAMLQKDIRINPFVINTVSPAPTPAGPDAAQIKLSNEQVSNLTTQHILAKADREAAELRAGLVRDMVEKTGDIHSTSTVLNSGLVQRLFARRSRMERQLADLRATLLPSHPRLKRMNREMTALQAQIKGEARKAVTVLDDEAQIAAAREASLKKSLDELQKLPELSPVTRQKPAPIDPRLNRRQIYVQKIAASRNQLAGAQARQDALQAQAREESTLTLKATLVREAVAVVVPVFPKKNPITLLGMIAAFALGVLTLLFGRKSTAQTPHSNEPDIILTPTNDSVPTLPVPLEFATRSTKA